MPSDSTWASSKLSYLQMKYSSKTFPENEAADCRRMNNYED